MINKKGFTLIELVVVMAILIILATILVPIINEMYETANQATDNANARLIYNAAAIWFAENNRANSNIAVEDLHPHLGLSAFPLASSRAFCGDFQVAVTSSGSIEVSTDKPAVYHAANARLIPQG